MIPCMYLQCVREVLLLGHRQAFAWIDQWIEMSFDDVRQYETNLQHQTNRIVHQQQNDVGAEKEIAPLTPLSDLGSTASSDSIHSVDGGPPKSPKSPTTTTTNKGYFWSNLF